MSDFTDQSYLLNEQYKTAANLNKRISLHNRFSTNPYGWFKWVFDNFHLPAMCRILELGCGSGDLWLQNLYRLPPDWQLFLSDFSGGMVRQARENLVGMRQACGFARIDAQALPFDDCRFEAVVANHILPHVPDRRKALTEIRRVLRPGGRLFATAIGDKHLIEILGLVGQLDPELVHGFTEGANMFTLENGLAQLFEWFPNVSIDRYMDSLCVTEADPLADYIFSSVSLRDTKVNRHELVDFLEHELTENKGAFLITKDSGIFEAYKPVG